MTLAPLLQASAAIQVHTVAALLAFVLGLVQLAGVKGTRRHVWLGWAWVAAMAVTALSSFAISELRPGAPSPIHALSLFALAWLPVGVLAARRGRARRHGRVMVGLFVGALVVAGAFTLWPGRIMHAAILSP